MRLAGLVLVLLSLGLAGGVATHAVGGAGADAAVVAGERCEVRAPEPTRHQIELTPPPAGVAVVPLNTRGYNYADPVPEPTPARGAEQAPPASPKR
jgi:hypothetical protein